VAAKSVLEIGRDRAILVSFNDTCHLQVDEGEQEAAG